MLEEAANGTLSDFWMDAVRSNCYATVLCSLGPCEHTPQPCAEPRVPWSQFETKEQAAACREGVYDMVWPTGRHKHTQ